VLYHVGVMAVIVPPFPRALVGVDDVSAPEENAVGNESTDLGIQSDQYTSDSSSILG
jgi:hypothetical protein